LFVVRLKRPGEDLDLKAFGSRRAAMARFRTAQREMIDGAIEACALLDIEAPNAVSALELAAQGHCRVIEADLQDPAPQVSAPEAKTPRSRPTDGSPTS
jgi:hypothetical protein